ncbi:MAG: COX15/CtaA family protein [Verrucomicrobiae bacterium]|nr:COX15/CtaA family protein [Verrucomicrobiae bacterium]
MTIPQYRASLFWASCFVAFATLILIGAGGLVTSHNVGMSVPDWPTTYGYNMFFFPWSKMVGGILMEHSHRLIASGVGFLTIFLAIFITIKEKRSWIKKLAWLAVLLVVLQGVLGGLRVVWMKDEIGIFHACLAQSFLVLMSLLPLFFSRTWLDFSLEKPIAKSTFTLTAITLGLIFLQLILGAIMRHEHADLAITDFPLAYGQVIPNLDEARLNQINERRLQIQGLQPTDRFQIHLQLGHRGIAGLIFLGVISCWISLFRERNFLRKWATLWLCLVILQIALGAWTIWSNKAADVATGHVIVGSLIFVTGSLLLALLWRARVLARIQVENSVPIELASSIV